MNTRRAASVGILALGMAAIWLQRPLVATAAGTSVGGIAIPQVSVSLSGGSSSGATSNGLQALILLTVLSLAPSIVLMLTSFTRIVVVLSFVRTALGVPQAPPNQVLIGLALFLTAFVMAPVATKINSDALQPYLANTITQQQALDRGIAPLRTFMLHQTRQTDLSLFISLSHTPRPNRPADVPTYVLIPAFMISELKTAFTIGFLIFIPFLIIDMVVSSILMSMGMMMLPPTVISLPFKLLLFVMVDGWHLIISSLVQSFNP